MVQKQASELKKITRFSDFNHPLLARLVIAVLAAVGAVLGVFLQQQLSLPLMGYALMVLVVVFLWTSVWHVLLRQVGL